MEYVISSTSPVFWETVFSTKIIGCMQLEELQSVKDIDLVMQLTMGEPLYAVSLIDSGILILSCQY